MENKKSGQYAATGHRMDLTTGRLGRKILLFVLPLVMMNILQQLFNTADIAVVGRLIGKEALAAVGATGSVVTLFINNLFSAILLFLMLEKEEGALRIRLHQIRFYCGIPGEILMIGVPSAVQGVLFNIGNVVIQSGINSLGTVAVAGSTIGMNVEVFPNDFGDLFRRAAGLRPFRVAGAPEPVFCLRCPNYVAVRCLSALSDTRGAAGSISGQLRTCGNQYCDRISYNKTERLSIRGKCLIALLREHNRTAPA